MKDEDLRKAWSMLGKHADVPESEFMTPGQYVRINPGSIQDKIRNILQYDLILKGITGILLLLDFIFYLNRINELSVILSGILLFAVMIYLEIKTLQKFDSMADPGQTTKENLSSMMVFLRRKSFLYGVLVASSNLLLFVSGLLLYFYAFYGYFKPLNIVSFSVFSILCLIGVISQFLRTQSQIGFYISHLSVFLSDINNDALAYVSASIEKARKQDMMIRGLVGLLLIFGFVIMIALIKSIGH